MSFSEFQLHPNLMKGLDALSFHEPTPIQQQAIPAVLSKRDVLASAQTGTGKTLAFILPMLHRQLEQHPKGIGGLVLLPTRELAGQVAQVVRDVSRFSPMKVALIVGGESFGMQLKSIRSGATLVIATPGRLLDHLERKTISLNAVHTLVLDEADRMLDMGFAPAIRSILNVLPKERQTMLFSATLPKEITQLGHLALKQPVSIQLSTPGSTADSVTQMLYPVSARQKNDLLFAILRNTPMQSVLIFSRTKHGADRLANVLQANDFSVTVMHSDRSQSQRHAALQGFKSGKYQLMVATDIAARGIDVKKLSHVINFDVPQHTDDYIHRIGRTGRSTEIGDAYTLVSPDEERYVAAIERLIKRKLPRVQVPDFPYDRLPPPPKPKSAFQSFGRKRRSIPFGKPSFRRR